MSLASFDVELLLPHQRGNTSENPALANVLIGIDQVLCASARELYGTLVDPEVDIRRLTDSDFYEVDYGFRQNRGMARRATLSNDAFLTNPEPMVVMEALGWREVDLADPSEAQLPPGTVRGVFPLLLKLSTRSVQKIFLLEDNVDIESAGELFHITHTAYRLLRSRAVRAGIEKIARAFVDTQLHEIRIKSRVTGQIVLTLASKDILSLKSPETKDVVLVDEVRTMALSLCAPNFRNDRFWTFENGAQRIEAKMSDTRFLDLIDTGVRRLECGDILVVRMHMTTYQKADGLMSRYEVVRVIDVRKNSEHFPMPGV